MPTAYNGKILHVDLSSGRTWDEVLPDAIYRRYLGGSALASYLMLRDIPAHVDPLGPDNKLILMTSVTNGLPLSGCNRYTAAGKSPLTGGFGGELSALIVEQCFDHLDAPIVRVASWDTPVPFAIPLEKGFLPKDRLWEAVERLAAY